LTTSLEAAAESSSIFSRAVAQNIADLTGFTSISKDQTVALSGIEKEYTSNMTQVYLDYAAGKISSQSDAYEALLKLQREYQKQSKDAQAQYQAELDAMTPSYMKMQKLQDYVTNSSFNAADSQSSHYMRALQDIADRDIPDAIKQDMLTSLVSNYQHEMPATMPQNMPLDMEFGSKASNNSFSITINAGASLVDKNSFREFMEMAAVEMQKAGVILPTL